MESRKLLLFGSTGLIGNAVLRQALDRNYRVTAVVRSKERLKDFTHDNLNVVEGNSMDQSTFDSAMEGQDAVVSCISARGRMYFRVNLYSVSVKEIHESMAKHGVQRCAFMSGWGSFWSQRAPWYVNVGTLFIKNHLNDLHRMEQYLEAHKDEMNYTIVRPPSVTGDPLMDGDLLTCDDDCFVPGASWKISRENVAKYILDSLETDTNDRKAISIGLKA